MHIIDLSSYFLQEERGSVRLLVDGKLFSNRCREMLIRPVEMPVEKGRDIRACRCGGGVVS